MGRRKRYSRDTVLNQALGQFYAKGFHSTSLRDLTEATGLNKKSLYAEFASKEALFQEAIRAYIEQMKHKAGYLLVREPLGRSNIFAFFEAMLGPPFLRGCLLTLTVNERETVSSEAMSLVLRAYDRLERAFAKNLLRDAIPYTPEKVAVLAPYLTVALQGLTTAARLGTQAESLAHIARYLLWPLSAGPEADLDALIGRDWGSK